MAKRYYYLIAMFCLVSVAAIAQEAKQQPKNQENPTIEWLNLYPNPVSNGKIYIETKNNVQKEIVIFDVLGKKVLQYTMTSKELFLGNLGSGVYIIKIVEGKSSATRKLVVK